MSTLPFAFLVLTVSVTNALHSSFVHPLRQEALSLLNKKPNSDTWAGLSAAMFLSIGIILCICCVMYSGYRRRHHMPLKQSKEHSAFEDIESDETNTEESETSDDDVQINRKLECDFTDSDPDELTDFVQHDILESSIVDI